jgi:hypothetical protein
MKFPTHGLMAPDAGTAGGGDGGGKVAIGGPQAVFGGMGEPPAATTKLKRAAPEKPTRSGVVETPAVVRDEEG